MTDLKTTITGLIGGIVMMLSAIGIGIPAEVSQGVIAICLFLVAFFAKDKP